MLLLFYFANSVRLSNRSLAKISLPFDLLSLGIEFLLRNAFTKKMDFELLVLGCPWRRSPNDQPKALMPANLGGVFMDRVFFPNLEVWFTNGR